MSSPYYINVVSLIWSPYPYVVSVPYLICVSLSTLSKCLFPYPNVVSLSKSNPNIVSLSNPNVVSLSKSNPNIVSLFNPNVVSLSKSNPNVVSLSNPNVVSLSKSNPNIVSLSRCFRSIQMRLAYFPIQMFLLFPNSVSSYPNFVSLSIYVVSLSKCCLNKEIFIFLTIYTTRLVKIINVKCRCTENIFKM